MITAGQQGIESVILCRLDDAFVIRGDEHIDQSAPDARARSAVRITMGFPQISTKGLSGRRVEASRAGTTARKRMYQTALAPRLECPGVREPRFPT